MKELRLKEVYILENLLKKKPTRSEAEFVFSKKDLWNHHLGILPNLLAFRELQFSCPPAMIV